MFMIHGNKYTAETPDNGQFDLKSLKRSVAKASLYPIDRAEQRRKQDCETMRALSEYQVRFLDGSMSSQDELQFQFLSREVNKHILPRLYLDRNLAMIAAAEFPALSQKLYGKLFDALSSVQKLFVYEYPHLKNLARYGRLGSIDREQLKQSKEQCFLSFNKIIHPLTKDAFHVNQLIFHLSQSIQELHFDQDDDWLEEMSLALPAHAYPELTSICIRDDIGISVSLLETFLKAAPHLEELDIKGARLVGPETLLDLEPNSLSSLKQLSLCSKSMGGQLPILFAAAPNLEDLVLTGFSLWSGWKTMVLASQSLMKLERLTLDDWEGPPEGLRSFLEAAPHLKIVDIDNETVGFEEGIRAVAKDYPQVLFSCYADEEREISPERLEWYMDQTVMTYEGASLSRRRMTIGIKGDAN